MKNRILLSAMVAVADRGMEVVVLEVPVVVEEVQAAEVVMEL